MKKWAERQELEGLGWRRAELEATDTVMHLTDHPSRELILEYRQALRDWPSTEDFPSVKPLTPVHID
jgi:hypothetical protein